MYSSYILPRSAIYRGRTQNFTMVIAKVSVSNFLLFLQEYNIFRQSQFKSRTASYCNTEVCC